MRPLRRIDDQADVLERPGDHQPSRPSWTCAAGCGDWPCALFRGHLLATLDRSAIASLMATFYQAALLELSDEPEVVHARLFAWHRREDTRRPPGGPF